MSVFAMESQCMKTIMIPLIDKSDFIIPDHQHTLQIFALIPVELAKSEDFDFFCIKLALQKISASRKCKIYQEISTILCKLVC